MIKFHPDLVQSSEAWLIIAEFPDYAVSSLGRISRVVPDQKGRMSGRALRPTPDSDGYLQVNLFLDGRARTRKVHALVCTAFHGARPSPEHEVAHGDGVQSNNCAGNLRWATRKENAEDRDFHGRTVCGDRHHSRANPEGVERGDSHWSRRRPEQTTKGERHGASKLTAQDVVSIRADDRLGREIAIQYDVTPTTVSYIKRRKTWGHVA